VGAGEAGKKDKDKGKGKDDDDDLLSFFHRARGPTKAELSSSDDDDDGELRVVRKSRGNPKGKGVKQRQKRELRSSDEEGRRREKQQLKERFSEKKKDSEAAKVKKETKPKPASEPMTTSPPNKVVAISSDSSPEPECRPPPPKLPLFRRTAVSAPPPPQEPLAPVINLLITSPIDGATALIVRRRLDQTLKEPRLHWCHVQGYDPEQTASVFLVWKKRFRIMDGTSCKGIGVKIEDINNMFDEDGVNKGHVHFEAMTEEIFRNVRQGLPPSGVQADESDKERGGGDGDDDDHPQISLTLQAGGRKGEAFKIAVKVSSTVAFLIDEYKKNRNVEPGKEVKLSFEGEYLGPQAKISDTELEDDCMVDVTVS